MREPALTTLIVPVPEAEPAVEEWRRRHDVWAQRGVPAHMTIVGPFLPADRVDRSVLARLEELASAHRAWPFSLTRVRRLGGAVVLLPDHASGFVDLREVVLREWPELRRRRLFGAHLTVARGWSPFAALVVARALRSRLPIESSASELVLLELSERSRPLARVRFGL
jgi:hypothetical protein